MQKNAKTRPPGRVSPVSSDQKIWTPEMEQYARIIAADKQKSIDLLKRAGILNEQGELAAEYAS